MKATVRDGSMSLPQWRATNLTQMGLDNVDKMIGYLTNLSSHSPSTITRKSGSVPE